MAETPEHISEQLEQVPAVPGVYLMRDEDGKVLYIGKAKVLRNRVRSYWHASAQHSSKTRRLVAQVEKVDWITTNSELEALLLENELIKQHKPRYNIRLKDDKKYPYIKVTWKEEFPKVFFTRQVKRDGNQYFGPFSSAWAVRETLELLRKRFPYLTCNRTITGEDERACLYYHIKLCGGPCIGAQTKEEYRDTIQGLMDFLEGKGTEETLEQLRAEMMEASENLEFERAAALRDQLVALEKVAEKQNIISTTGGDQDVVAFAREDGDACVQIFYIRSGKLIGREYIVLEGTDEADTEEIMEQFLQQFYDDAINVPPEILLEQNVDEGRIIQQWLRSKRGADVVLHVPKRGNKKELVELAHANAVETLSALRAQWQSEAHRQSDAIADLQEVLNLAEPPVRIECYDISHAQGTNVVGSMVVFDKGVPRKSDYRKFKISEDKNDDVANMREVLYRRFSRWHEAQRTPGGNKWGILPNLVVIDGGKGQLNAAWEVIQEFDLGDVVPAIGLAKREEEIFMPGVREPIRLEPGSAALQLLQRVRDEAHRFAVSYHRQLRRKRGLASSLEEIPGIGPKRRARLLKTFGSLDAIRAASLDQLAAVPGMTRSAAERIKELL
ncbi:MAG: excinuclease ABC subunit UvrC [Chloroflexota bacterium]|nr:excinuclease ABC subunit UvrC [Chloroflexota bacterium]